MEKKVGIIGYGSMGKMIFSKFIESKIIKESNLFVANRTYDKIKNLDKIYPKVNICKHNIDVVKNVDILFICVKPLEIKTVLMEIIKDIKNDSHIVSLNGSVLFEQLEQICVNSKLSKVIPSVTAEINQSVTLVCQNAIIPARVPFLTCSLFPKINPITYGGTFYTEVLVYVLYFIACSK